MRRVDAGAHRTLTDGEARVRVLVARPEEEGVLTGLAQSAQAEFVERHPVAEVVRVHEHGRKGTVRVAANRRSVGSWDDSPLDGWMGRGIRSAAIGGSEFQEARPIAFPAGGVKRASQGTRPIRPRAVDRCTRSGSPASRMASSALIVRAAVIRIFLSYPCSRDCPV